MNRPLRVSFPGARPDAKSPPLVSRFRLRARVRSPPVGIAVRLVEANALQGNQTAPQRIDELLLSMRNGGMAALHHTLRSKTTGEAADVQVRSGHILVRLMRVRT